MHWECERRCGAGGSKLYSTEEDAHRYAVAFDHRDRDTLGDRAPLGLTPLRLLRRSRRRRAAT